MGKMFVVTSGKGGTGKTTVAVNLAATLAETGAKVVLADMNIGFRNADLFMGKENDVVYDSSDVIHGVCKAEQALVKDDRFADLYLLAAAPEHEEGMNLKRMRALLQSLKESFDYVIVDMPSGMSRMITYTVCDADRVLLVTTPDYASIRNTDALDRRLLEIGSDRQSVILNRVVPELMNEGVVPKLREIAVMLRPEIEGLIQEDKVVLVSANVGVPVIMKKGTYIRFAFEKIVDELK